MEMQFMKDSLARYPKTPTAGIAAPEFLDHDPLMEKTIDLQLD
jgi:hypothetical protein